MPTYGEGMQETGACGKIIVKSKYMSEHDHKRDALDKVNPYRRLTRLVPNKILINRSEYPDEAAITQSHLFMREAPRIFCEIGSGSGLHLLALARAFPTTLCLGYELRFKRAYRTIEKAQEASLHNIAVYRTNGNYLSILTPPHCIDGIFINFPDPWDKRRWKKNRIVNSSYLETLYKVLKPGGFFAFKSDHREYAEEVERIIDSSPLFRMPLLSDEEISDFPTEFELLFRSQGLDRFRIIRYAASLSPSLSS
jgi:tRNA (guanine-N7-)-methyltransferase